MKNNKKGFTLAELLVVVAIIGVLVAVSIPIFTAQLEKAREATDVANLRAAKAAAVVEYLNADHNDAKVTWNATDDGFTGYYDTVTGMLTTTKPTVAQMKGTATDGKTAEFALSATTKYANTTDYTKDVIAVTVDANGNVTLAPTAIGA